jgi:ABC-type lipoprotein export system ATPase subunit
MTTLSARSLAKLYGGDPSHAAVRCASLELRAGELVSIVGRSGSGKSTLLAMLGALTRPSAGNVLLDGVDLWTLPEAARAEFRARRVGFIFQFPSLLANLTAVDNVAVPALLGRTMDPGAAYARAYDLLARVGLRERAHAYPGGMSGGEQRRAAIARALINAPPTSDLDEDTDAEIIALLEALQRTECFGLLLVTHNLQLARRAQRRYEMRQGALTEIERRAIERPASAGEPAPARCLVLAAAQPPAPDGAAAAATAPIRLGAGFGRGVRTFLAVGAAILAIVLLADFGVGKYQQLQLRQRAARSAALQNLALNSLRGDVQSVADLGDGRYELTTYLQNVGGGAPIYVMAPELRAYVQVKTAWQEVPMTPLAESASGVRKIEGRQVYRYVFDARLRDFAQPLPNYMHVRFAGSMLVSPSSTPSDDLFERRDNYYVYLKPFDVADEAILQRMRFTGKPPVWIPMPPH